MCVAENTNMSGSENFTSSKSFFDRWVGGWMDKDIYKSTQFFNQKETMFYLIL